MKKFIFYMIIFIILLLILSEITSRFGIIDIIKPQLEKIYNLLSYSISLSENIHISLLGIISFVFVIFIGINIAKVYKSFIYSIKKHRKDISFGTITILAKIGYYVIITIVLFISLKIVGIDLSNFAMIISALSVGIGFGLQTIVSNFISGIILMFEQSIKEGDYIEVGTDLRGTVTSIDMRSTTIRTHSNIDIVIPNQSFIQNNIVNWTHTDNIVRLKIPFGVAYGSSVEEVEKLILKALEKSTLNYIREDDEKKPIIIMDGMGSSSVNFLLLVRVESDKSHIPLIAKSGYLKLIYNTLNENNIAIPFPQTDLHIKDSIPIEINMKK